MTDPFLPDPDPWRSDAADGPDLTDSFWGDQAEWAARPTTPDVGAAARGGAVSRWWGAATAGRTRATRTRPTARAHTTGAHGISEPLDEPLLPDVDDGAADWSGEWERPAEPPRAGVDPLLARLGGLAVLVTLLVPVVIGFASDSGSTDSARLSSTEQVPDISTIGTGVTSAAPEPSPSSGLTPVSTAPATTAAALASADDVPADPPAAPTPSTGPIADDTVDPGTTVDAQSLAASCGQDYEIVAGDFWIRIADGSGADLGDLLAVNGATQNTPLYPGRSICLPIGAAQPPPPPTTTDDPPTATAAPAPTASPSGSSVTTKPVPATTVAPTPTTTLPRGSNASATEVEAIIRSVWPDDLEDRALAIAWRESKYIPTAKSACCSGLFQIYWSVHQSWLDDLGITSSAQLYDPTTNARAAYALYQRAGGFGPWGG